MSLLGSFLVIFTGLTLMSFIYWGFLYFIKKKEINENEDENKKNLIE